MYKCISTCTCLYTLTYIYIYIYIHTHTHTHTLTHTHTHTPTQTQEYLATTERLRAEQMQAAGNDFAACCSMLQHVAACCSVLQCVAVCCSVLQCVAVCYSVLQYAAVYCSVMPRRFSTPRVISLSFFSRESQNNCVLSCAWSGSVRVLTHCNTLQHPMPHCNTLRHAAPLCKICNTLHCTTTPRTTQQHTAFLFSPQLTSSGHQKMCSLSSQLAYMCSLPSASR